MTADGAFLLPGGPDCRLRLAVPPGSARPLAAIARGTYEGLRRGSVAISSTFAGAAAIEVRSGGEVVTAAIAAIGAGEDPGATARTRRRRADYRVALKLTAPDGREARHHLRVVTLRRLSRTEARREARHFERRSRVAGAGARPPPVRAGRREALHVPGRAGRAPPGPGPRRVRRRLDRAAAARRAAQPRARGAAGVPEARARAMRALLVALALLVVLPATARGGRAGRDRARIRRRAARQRRRLPLAGPGDDRDHEPGQRAARRDRRPAVGERRAGLRTAALGRDLQPRGRRARRPHAPELHRGAGEARRAARARRAGDASPSTSTSACRAHRRDRFGRGGKGVALLSNADPRARAPRGRARGGSTAGSASARRGPTRPRSGACGSTRRRRVADRGAGRAPARRQRGCVEHGRDYSFAAGRLRTRAADVAGVAVTAWAPRAAPRAASCAGRWRSPEAAAAAARSSCSARTAGRTSRSS